MLFRSMLHGQTRYNLRSRFLDELPEESLKWLSPQTKPGWFSPPRKAAWDDNPASGANQIASQMRKQGGQDNGWRPGQNVSHPKFGEGVIVQLEGSGSQARAHINFGKFGMKLLDLSVAKLEKI